MENASNNTDGWQASLRRFADSQSDSRRRLLNLVAQKNWSDEELDTIYSALADDRAIASLESKVFRTLRKNPALLELDREIAIILSLIVESNLRESEINYILNFLRLSKSDWRKRVSLLSRTHGVPDKVRQLMREVTLDESEDLKKVRFFCLMMQQAPYWEDLVASRAAAHWLEDERFKADYQAGASISTWGHDIRWRIYTLLKCAALANRVEGDFVECGVDRGGTAMCVLHHLTPDAFAKRKFYLFDTYEGLNAEQQSEEEARLSRLRKDRYMPVVEQVRKTFSPYHFVRIVPGTVPQTLDQYLGDGVAYLHIDMNVSLPEREALRFFWPKLQPGAPVIFDDYGFPFHVQQRKALDATVEDLGAEIMMLPTGQGILWKR